MDGKSELYRRIIEEYNKNVSLKDISEMLKVSIVRVRRVLITEDLWHSETSDSIGKLYKQGLSVKEIAAKLYITEKNVQAYIPYSKGIYGNDIKSNEATRCENYRQRNKRIVTSQPKGIHKENPKLKREEILEDSKMNNTYKLEYPIALKLHLELNTEDIEDERISVLRKYAKVNKGITRDIIVPANITLHALHYVIQKLFGWQNSHLHHYALPEKVFSDLTHNQTKQWLRLCGVYFRFPDVDDEDRYWDDDYDESVSFNTWLKRKYKGPYKYSGLGDYYFTNQMHVEDLKQKLPIFKVGESFTEYMNRSKNPNIKSKPQKLVSLENATIEELINSITFEEPLNSLLERQFIMDYILLPNNRSLCFLDGIEEKLAFLEDGLEDNIENWKEILLDISNRYREFCDVVNLSTVRSQAVTDTLEYFYDYGDGWKVTINCSEAYYKDEMQSCIVDSCEKRITDDTAEYINSVIIKYSPVCIASDGMNVMDDVGGISGYCNFLSTIHESKNEEKKIEMREWGRYMGWTGRNSNPLNRL